MANPGSIVDYEGNRAIVGDRVELHPATDWWMRGARFGIIKSLKTRADGQPTAVVRLDNYPRRALHFLGRDFRKITVAQMNPGKRKVHSAAFDRCVSDVQRKPTRRGKKVRNAFAVCTSSLGRRAFRKRRLRRGNPSRYGRGVMRSMYKLVAQRPGGARLQLVSGNKFAERGRPVHFPVRSEAEATARWLKRQFASALRGYAVTVECCT